MLHVLMYIRTMVLATYSMVSLINLIKIRHNKNIYHWYVMEMTSVNSSIQLITQYFCSISESHYQCNFVISTTAI